MKSMERRGILKAGGAGLLLTGLRSALATATPAGMAALTAKAWAKAGGATMLTAANDSANNTFLVGLDDEGRICFQLPIPSRGHAAAIHPARAEAVAFARRPGRFAIVIDCASGREIARLDAAKERHFYGHGAFTPDGAFLLTTENAYEIPDGRIGVWDVAAGYRRIGEFASGGIGPHEMIRLADNSYAIANGGIQTHPDYARSMLNLHKMRPNLTIMSANGDILDQVEPDESMHRNSIRHIAADSSDRIFIALQWQGNPMARVPLVASYRRGEAGLTFLDHPQMARLKQYAGSIAISGDESEVAVTGPKGGHVLFFDRQSGKAKDARKLAEASGASRLGSGFAITVQGGVMIGDSTTLHALHSEAGLAWDNHLVPV